MNDLITMAETGEELPLEVPDFAEQLKSPSTDIYCSFTGGSLEEKKILYRAMNQPDEKLNDHLNKEIRMKDLFCETIFIKREDGTTAPCPRLVIIDDKGRSYQSVSFGVFNSIRRIVDIFGTPTWDEPITVIPVQRSSGKNKITVLNIK